MLSAPTPTSPTRAASCRYSSGSWSAEPWCETFTTSTAPSGSALPERTRRCAVSPRSPRNTPDRHVGQSPPGSGSVTSTMLASLPASGLPARGHTTRQPSGPSTPDTRSSACRTSTPPRCRSCTTRLSDARPTGPTSAVSTMPATSSTAPTWSRSKCVRTSRSIRRTRSRSRQARRRSGSSPVSISAVLSPPRTSTASPCPTSHAATAQSRGTVPRTTSTGTATAATPTTTTTPATSSRRLRTIGVLSTATARHPLTTTAPTTPTVPPGHGADAYGSSAAPWAMPPTADAGAQATAASTDPPHGQTGASRHTPRPTTVTIGARGSASRFAGTA